MRSTTIHQATALLAALFAIQAGAVDPTISVTYGRDDKICSEVADVVRRSQSEDFVDSPWRNSFRSVTWQSASSPAINAEGIRHDVPFEFSQLDIDNDGVEEIVIMTTGSVRSVDFNWLYKVSAEEFHHAQKEETVWALLENADRLDFGNGVTFTNGDEAIPVELHVWRRGKETLVLMKENYFFRTNQRRLPNAIVVGRLQSPPNSKRAAMQLHLPPNVLVPQLICRMTARYGQ